MDEGSFFDSQLHDYYKETDYAKRQAILSSFSCSGVDVEKEETLISLWKLRYRETKNGVGDSFLGAFMELYYAADEIDSIFRKKYNLKIVNKALFNLGLGPRHSFPEEMLYVEHKHLAMCYIAATQQNGGPRLFGFSMHSKPQDMTRKLKSDLFKVAVELPKRSKLQREFAPLSRALLDASKEQLEEGN